VGDTLITVPARILAPPQIAYKDTKRLVTPRFGGWNMNEVKFSRSGSVSNWTYICLKQEKTASDAPEPEDKWSGPLVQSFVNFMIGMGMSFTPRMNLPTSGPSNNLPRLKDIFGRMKERGVRWVLIILPASDARLYKLIKSQCDVAHGLHSVCVVRNKFDAADLQYFANVALKFNLKAGGINHVVQPAKLGIISTGKTMVGKLHSSFAMGISN